MNIVLTRTLSYVSGFTAFNSADTGEQAGYYLPICFTIPDNVDMSKTVVNANGTTINSTADEPTDRQFRKLYFLGTDANAIKNKTFTFEIDWDGDSTTWATKLL